MLRFWRWLKTLAMPASGRHAHDWETRDFWDDESADLPPDYDEWSPEDEDGEDPFWRVRETRAEKSVSYVRPYVLKYLGELPSVSLA